MRFNLHQPSHALNICTTSISHKLVTVDVRSTGPSISLFTIVLLLYKTSYYLYSLCCRRSMRERVLVTLVLLTAAAAAHRCDRTPEGHVAPKIPADNRFQLKVSGSPDKYVPGEGYTSEQLTYLLLQAFKKILSPFLICQLVIQFYDYKEKCASAGNGMMAYVDFTFFSLLDIALRIKFASITSACWV